MSSSMKLFFLTIYLYLVVFALWEFGLKDNQSVLNVYSYWMAFAIPLWLLTMFSIGGLIQSFSKKL